MSGILQAPSFFIGWDVGGWNCDRNATSRDAIVILDSSHAIVGKPWRGNLRVAINEAFTPRDWTAALFSLCMADRPDDNSTVTLAIDTPLGFSEAFVRLVTGLECKEPVTNFRTNPYLFRETERFLFEKGLTPLSAVNHQIGSQATKGMHVLAKFAHGSKSCGVWTDGGVLTAIEAYPSPCKESAIIQQLRSGFSSLDHADIEDALSCALIAYLFTEKRETLVGPDESVPRSEGWIWVPNDVF